MNVDEFESTIDIDEKEKVLNRSKIEQSALITDWVIFVAFVGKG